MYRLIPRLTICLFVIAGCQQDALIASNCAVGECVVGAPLLTVSGSVDIEGGASDDSELSPALAFFNAKESRFHVVDVEVQGEFPSRFTIRVRQPPPQDAVVEGPAGFPWALAYLTAISPDHPQSVGYSQLTHGGGGCWDETPCDGDAGAAQCPPLGWTSERPCEITETWCSVGRDDCYMETRWCPQWNAARADCELVQGDGDPALRRDPWDTFAGLSEDLVVIYLVDPLEAGDPAARAFDNLSLEAGYHLMQLAKPDPAEREARDACEAQARELVAKRFNAQYGTNFTGDQLPAGLRCASQTECDARDALVQTLDARLHSARQALWCPPLDVAMHPIENAAGGDQAISVRIAPRVSPLGTPYGGAPPRLLAPELPADPPPAGP